MDIKEEILKEHSRKQATKIADYIGNDKEKFGQLMKFFFTNNTILSQRSAWVMSSCVIAFPTLIVPYLKQLLENLENPVHPAVKRNSIKVLELIEIPSAFMGIATNVCFKILLSNKEEVAQQAYAMSVLYNIAKKEPELKNEIKLVIEDMLPHGSPAILSRGKKVLAQLAKL